MATPQVDQNSNSPQGQCNSDSLLLNDDQAETSFSFAKIPGLGTLDRAKSEQRQAVYRDSQDRPRTGACVSCVIKTLDHCFVIILMLTLNTFEFITVLFFTHDYLIRHRILSNVILVRSCYYNSNLHNILTSHWFQGRQTMARK